MKVYLEEHETLQMKEIESWLQHGPDSVPTITREEILEADTYSSKVTLVISTAVAIVAALAVYGLIRLLS